MTNFDELKNEANTYLKKVLEQELPNHQFRDVLNYATFPAGKLFRSLLIYSFSKDKNCFNKDQALWAASIELHHTYTLIHDDLPAMDDDDIRRNRPSTHKKFNEWNAILAGDGLLAMSYGALAQMPPDKLPTLLELYHKCTGVSGLILGQVLDLAGEDKSLEKLLTIHKLKTARLIQLAIQGSNILAGLKIPDPVCEKIGLDIGINFQLLDDLCELGDELGEHELKINPFLHFDSSHLLDIIEENSQSLRTLLADNGLNNLRDYLNIYMEKIQTKLISGQTNINNHIKLDLLQIERIKV